jgi:acetate kinase
MTVALGGIQQLIFTGGIGENAAAIRAAICRLLSIFGLQLDASANSSHCNILTNSADSIEVRIMPAREEMRIARISAALT